MKREINEIIRDYLSGERLSDEELEQLEAWRRQSGKHHRWLTYLSGMNRGKAIRENMQHRPHLRRTAIEEHVAAFRRREKRIKWASVAAGLILLAGFSFFFAKSVYQEPALPVAQQQAIQPGSSQARLILENGENILLSHSAQGIVLEDKDYTIKNDTASISYTGVSIETGELKYNTLQIPVGAEYSVLLSDGTKVYLNSGSELRYPVAFGREKREVWLSGEAYFEVTPDTSRLFVVKTELLNAVVRGTSFNIRAYPLQERIEATLVDGKLAVICPDKSYEITPGMQVLYNKKEASSTQRNVDVELYTSWKDGYYYFQQASLEEMLNTLALWYNLEISYRQEELKKLRFSGQLKRYEDMIYLLNKIEETNEIRFNIQHNHITVEKK